MKEKDPLWEEMKVKTVEGEFIDLVSADDKLSILFGEPDADETDLLALVLMGEFTQEQVSAIIKNLQWAYHKIWG